MAYIPREKVRVVMPQEKPAAFGRPISEPGMFGLIFCYIFGALLFSIGVGAMSGMFSMFCITISVFAAFGGLAFLRKWVDF